MIGTETIYAALFGLLAPLGPVASGGDGTFKTVTRRLQLVEDVPSNAMPYVGQLQLDRMPDRQTTAGVNSWMLKADWYIYAFAPNMDAASSPILNPLVDAVLNLFPQEYGSALAFQIGGKTVTLECGGAEFFEGLLDQKAVAKIQIKMSVPN